MRFLSTLHSFLDKLSFARFKSNSLSKNECKILMNLILFDPPKLGTPPKLVALTVGKVAFCHLCFELRPKCVSSHRTDFLHFYAFQSSLSPF